jgi:uncharacterized protein (DUF58 family)
VSARRAIGALLAGIALIVVALAFDSAPLFVPGVAFALLGAGAPAWVWSSARALTVERRIDTDRVTEGEPFESMVKVRTRGPRLAGVELRDSLTASPVRLLGGGRTTRVRVVAHFERRGLRRIAPPSVTVADPLQLAVASAASSGGPSQVLVVPRTEPVNWHRAGRRDRWEGRARGESLAAVEVDGLRPYRTGTPASRIHWQALARGAGLLERRLEPEADHRPLVVLDARGSGPPEQLDAAVRAAASLALELARAGGCALLLPGDRRASAVEPELGSWPVAHARLALVEGGPQTPPPALGAMRGRSGTVFYVAARPVDRAPEALGRGRVVLVVPAAIAPRLPASFEVSGCVGFVVNATTRRVAVSAASGLP